MWLYRTYLERMILESNDSDVDCRTDCVICGYIVHEERFWSVTIVTLIVVQISSFVAISYMEEQYWSVTIVTLIVEQIASFVAISYMEERFWSVTIVTLIVVQIASLVATSCMEERF